MGLTFKGKGTPESSKKDDQTKDYHMSPICKKKTIGYIVGILTDFIFSFTTRSSEYRPLLFGKDNEISVYRNQPSQYRRGIIVTEPVHLVRTALLLLRILSWIIMN